MNIKEALNAPKNKTVTTYPVLNAEMQTMYDCAAVLGLKPKVIDRNVLSCQLLNLSIHVTPARRGSPHRYDSLVTYAGCIPAKDAAEWMEHMHNLVASYWWEPSMGEWLGALHGPGHAAMMRRREAQKRYLERKAAEKAALKAGLEIRKGESQTPIEDLEKAFLYEFEQG